MNNSFFTVRVSKPLGTWGWAHLFLHKHANKVSATYKTFYIYHCKTSVNCFRPKCVNSQSYQINRVLLWPNCKVLQVLSKHYMTEQPLMWGKRA